ncbi:MAG: tyrosine-type recombinase/integrase [Streptosporangiales bacterium]
MVKSNTPPPNKGHRYPAEPLSAEEVSLLLRGCSLRAPTGIRNRALIAVMYRAGLRVSEALALRPSDVNTTDGTLRVLHGKGDKARTVGLDAGALDAVARWMDKRREFGFRNGPLFCTLGGGPLSAGYVRDMLKRQRAKAGIEKRVHPHGLRHTHAAELVREGVPINVIRDQLGHSSLAVTDRYLRNVAPADLIALGKSRTWTEGNR